MFGVAIIINGRVLFFSPATSFRYIDNSPFVFGRDISFRLEFDEGIVGAMCALSDTEGNLLTQVQDCKFKENFCIHTL